MNTNQQWVENKENLHVKEERDQWTGKNGFLKAFKKWTYEHIGGKVNGGSQIELEDWITLRL